MHLEFKLQSEIDTLVRKNNDVFSAVLGVSSERGDFHWAGASGTAYPDETVSMSKDTPIFLASITKMFTAAVTMILVERGLLSLDDPLSKHMPSSITAGLHRFKGVDYSDQLRIYHLISQTSGLPDYFEESPKNGRSVLDQIIADGDMEWDVEDVVRIAKSGLSPKFPPETKEQERSGGKAHYADTNYQLLGAAIESAAQRSLFELFTELILEPLELSATYLHGHGDPETSAKIPPANIYHKTTPLFLDKSMTSFGPDGGMVSTIDESLIFIKHFMKGRLFQRSDTVNRMMSWRRIFFPFQYGLGLMRLKMPRIFTPFSATPEMVGHSGASSAFLYYSAADQIYIGGTLNQIEKQQRPIRLMLKVIKMVSEARN